MFKALGILPSKLILILFCCLTFGQLSAAVGSDSCAYVFADRHEINYVDYERLNALIAKVATSELNPILNSFKNGKPALIELKTLTKGQISDAKVSPVIIGEYGSRADSLLYLFGNKIYFSGFFAKNFNRTGMDTIAELIDHQPYILLRENNYQLVDGRTENSGSREILLQMLSANSAIKLYRGANLLEAHLITIISKLEANLKISSEEMEVLKTDALSELDRIRTVDYYGESYSRKKMKKEAIRSLVQKIENSEDVGSLLLQANRALEAMWLSSDFKGVFLTPQKARSTYFSKGAVLEFEIDGKTLLSLVDKKQIYLGFESAIEMGFSPEALAVLKTSYLKFIPQKVSEIFAPSPY